MLSRPNTIIILVLEGEDSEHTCLSCIEPPHWPYVRNLGTKVLAHNRTLVFSDGVGYGFRWFHRDDTTLDDLLSKRTIMPPIDNDLWTVDNARGVAQLLHDQSSALHITVGVVLEIQWSFPGKCRELRCTMRNCLRHYFKPFLQSKLRQLSLVHVTIWPPGPDSWRAGSGRTWLDKQDFLAKGKVDLGTGDLDMDVIPWPAYYFLPIAISP